MTKISISELQSQDIQPLLSLIESENDGLIDTAINRALDARKISGGGSNSGLIIFTDPTHCGPLPGPEFS
jgi:hypothetical protein